MTPSKTQITNTPIEIASQSTSGQFQAFHRLLAVGVSPTVAADQLGVDQLLGRLWTALPADWLGPAELAGELAAEPVAPARPLPPPSVEGLSRTLLVRVPAGGRLDYATVVPALIESSQSPAALSNAVHAAKRGGYAGSTRVYTLPASVAYRLGRVAQENSVDGALVAGRLLAARWGLAVAEWKGVSPAPSAASAPASPVLRVRQRGPSAIERLARERARKAALAALEATAPTGPQLAQRRYALGISQRELAAAVGRSRGLIAEVEHEHRRHVLTRSKMSDVLARLERERAA